MIAGRRTFVCGLLGAAGLTFYLWSAVGAPVVLWSDSRIDMAWAREGVGIVSPASPPPSPHPAKPAWIAFLRAASAGASADAAPRRIVVVQTGLLWLSIAGVSVWLGRRTRFARGVVLYLTLLLFLRLPDAATSVMSEALTAALFLPIVVSLLDPPARARIGAALGAAVAVLLLVRPNAGAAAAILAALAFGATRRWRALAGFAASAAALVVPIWVLTTPRSGDPLRGLGPAFLWAGAEYGWTNSAGLAPPDASEATRQLVWRVFHGLLGGEHHDAAWSPLWSALDDVSRILSPLLILGALACLLAPSRQRGSLARLLGLALAVLLVAQSYVLGALPRFALPLLPGLFLCAVAAWPPVKSVAGVLFVGLLAAARWQRQILDREWGRIESSGIRIAQTIPKGALPAAPPASLRIRVAPVVLPSAARLAVLDPSGTVLYDSNQDRERRRPYVDVPLGPELLAANQRGPVTLTFLSDGAYGETQYLLFPVIPWPWGAPARRDGSDALSPSTGLRSGGLDWWVAPQER